MRREPNKDNVFYRDLRKYYPTIDRAEGIYLYDIDGKRYIDGCSGAVVVNIGHGIQPVLDAMMRQAKRICFSHASTFTSEAQIAFAEKVVALAPEGFSKVYFLSGGSEASETALKMARQYHVERGKPSKYKVISRWQSYHGNTIGALSMSGRNYSRKHHAPYMLNFPHISPCYCYRCPYEKDYPSCNIICAWELERVIKQEGKEYISAFIAEPIVGGTASGLTPPPEYFGVIREICDRYDVLFIVDEIMTGVGRTGKNFGIDHWGVIPDLIVAGKGLASGYAPIFGVIVREKIFETFRNGSGSFVHGHTFSGNPLACATGAAALDYLEEHFLIERSAKMGSYMFWKMNSLKDLPIVGDIRGKGLFLGVEFVADKDTKKPFGKEAHVDISIRNIAFEKGLNIIAGMPGMIEGELGDHILISPPFIIKEPEIDEIVDILRESIIEVTNQVA